MSQTCSQCGGTGKERNSHAQGPEWFPCDKCDGTGITREERGETATFMGVPYDDLHPRPPR